MTTDPQHWRMLVYGMLRAGFGVEDISIKLRSMGVNPWSKQHIREEIADLRKSGILSSILRRDGEADG